MSSPKNVRLFRPTLLCLEERTTPSAGMLDPTFGTGGKVTTRILSSENDAAYAMAIDGLGRIILAGSTNNGSNSDFAIIRLTPAGTLDPTFGTGGVVTVRFGISYDSATCVAIDSQSRIVVGGYSAVGSSPDFAVARLKPDGTLDPTFDGDGKQSFGFGALTDEAQSVAIDSLDRITLVGVTYNGSNNDFAIARLTTAGALDSSFDGDGKQTVTFGSSDDNASGVTIDSTNRIVVVGTTNIAGVPVMAVARLTVAGSLDASFDGDGKQTVTFGTSGQGASALALDSQGRIVLAGYLQQSTSNFAVARLTTAGALDVSFDGDGKQAISFGASALSHGVAVDASDRIVVVGEKLRSNGSTNVIALARLSASGALDPGFNGNGEQTVDYGIDDYGRTAAVDSLGRIMVAGYTNQTFFDFAAARLMANGALDPSFDGDGKVTIDLNELASGFGQSVTVDHLGRILVAGNARGEGLLNRSVFAVARYTPDGSLDPTFGGTGVVRFPIGARADIAYSVAVDSHNRVILAGYISYSLVDWDFAVARLTEAGGIDTSFNGNGKLTFSFSTGLETAKGVVIDAQDRIVIAGTATASGGMNVARVTTAGVLDPSFDGDGMATISFPGINTGAEGVAIDSLGRIVLAGSGGNPSEMAVACLTDAGIPDPSFDGDGLQTIAFGTTSCEGHSVAIDAFDRVVVAGDTVVGSFEKFAVARLTSAGALDSTFDGDGEQTVAFGTADEQAYGVAIDSQNRVVMTGFTNNGSNKDFAVTRLTSAGALDTSFDGDGKLTIAFGSFDETASSVAIAIGNRVIVAGSTDFDGKLFALARLTGDITTASAQVNDGAAQRSRVTSLTVRFSGQVTFSGSPDLAFTLVRDGGGSVSFTATVSVQNGGTVVTLDHFTGPDTEFGSLADGRYTLTALASQISVGGQALDGDADGTAGGNFVFNDTQGLFRLFGDVNGDQTVNGFDLGFFRNAFGTQTGDSNYLSYLDLNGDGVINGFDLGQFRTRFGTVLP